MESLRIIARVGACTTLAALLVAANLPRAMIGPGEWEIGKSAKGIGAERLCLTDPALLMQWEHRRRQCTRVIVTSSIDRAEVQYTCGSGGFGTSRITVLTPRSIKIDTQGIFDKYPFAYVLHARRVGDCPAG